MTPLARLFFSALAACALTAPATVAATVWHVDVAAPAAGDGRSRTAAFSSIQAGVDAAGPGDTVIVYPGIYYEHVGFGRGGEPGAPITLMADEVAVDRVIISGAVAPIRRGEVAWEPVDADAGLYRTSLGWRPTRVLAGRVDLLPYPALADLKAFRFLADDYPGHLHGFAWEDGFLYARLRADGKYGPVNPNEAAMAVSPPTGGGRWGHEPAGPGDFNLALRFRGPGHVIIDGFTFETPGIAAVYSEASDIIVRNSWFYGCRIGVAGFGGKDHQTDRVLVEHCHVTHYPAFTDIVDTIEREGAKQRAKPEWWQRIGHWQRKGGLPPASEGVGRAYSYEQGFIRRMGADWVVRNNHLFEVFEGLSNGATSRSSGARIYGNRFERICDNAVETEDHARDLHIYGNLVIDVFEPFSWQPLDRGPLPGPVYIHDNIVWQTPETAAMWAIAGNSGGLLKLGVKDRDWGGLSPEDFHDGSVAAPGGFWVTNNTLLTTEGNVITRLNSPGHRYAGFVFLNNVIVARRISWSPPVDMGSGLVMDNNLVATSMPGREEDRNFAGPGAFAAGPHGRVLGGLLEFGWNAPPGLENGWSLAPESPARDAGGMSRRLQTPAGDVLIVPEAVPLRADAGALPLVLKVGPLPR
jgi:hypothetical protein